MSILGKIIAARHDQREADIAAADEFIDDTSIRCPKCRHVHKLDFEDDVWQEGEHAVYCSADDCGHEFTIETRVSWVFESPAMGESEPF